MPDSTGSNLRSSHGHHCLGHGDLRPVEIKSSPSAGEPHGPIGRASNFSSWQRSCRNAHCVAHTAGDRNLVLTTVWRGYSPLAGSAFQYRPQTRKGKLFTRHSDATIRPNKPRTSTNETDDVFEFILNLERQRYPDSQLHHRHGPLSPPRRKKGHAAIAVPSTCISRLPTSALKDGRPALLSDSAVGLISAPPWVKSRMYPDPNSPLPAYL